MTDTRAFDDHTDDLVGPRQTTTAKAEPVATGSVRPRRVVFAGYTAGQLVVGLAVLLAILWGMWVTKTVIGEPPQHIVKADLSRIVGNYVQAQARSATPPAQVEAQMKLFMASLDDELQRRGAKGQVVLVGEAVLSKSVPDITADVMKAVYDSGVRIPQPASPAQMGATLGPQAPVAPQAMPTQAAQAPMAAGLAMPQTASAPVDPSQIAAPFDPSAGAGVTTFGGPGGQ